LTTKNKECKKCGVNCTDHYMTVTTQTQKIFQSGFNEPKLIGIFCYECINNFVNRPWWKKWLGLDELK